MADVAVVVPWRDPGCEFRREAWTHVTGLWRDAGYFVVNADSGHEPFNRSASRNLGASMVDAEVLVFCDADAVLPMESVAWAVEAARSAPGLVKPFARAGFLTAEASRIYLDGGPLVEELLSPVVEEFSGLAWVIHRDRLAELGGFDEGFVGYGGEDDAFLHVCDTLLGSTWWGSGTAYSLWHPNERSTSEENLHRWWRMREVKNWHDYMRVRFADAP